MKRQLNKKWIIILACIGGLVLILSTFFVGRYFYLAGIKKKNEEAKKTEEPKKEPEKPVEYPYTLVSYAGTVFGAKVPQGWNITSNESGIDVIDPTDARVGATGAIAVGWFGSQTPDSFISFMLNAVGATNVAYENESAQGTIKDPVSGLSWVMKTKTFTYTNKEGKKIKAKASAGVMNGYGQYMAMLTAFQTTPEKWSKWAPTLERVAQSIMIINPSKAGGIDKVRLPTAADLANDSSPLMEAWEYKSRSQDRTSHQFSDAIMGQESGLVSPSTGRGYTMPLTSYDPTIGGYRNPDNSSEILNSIYK